MDQGDQDGSTVLTGSNLDYTFPVSSQMKRTLFQERCAYERRLAHLVVLGGPLNESSSLQDLQHAYCRQLQRLAR